MRSWLKPVVGAVIVGLASAAALPATTAAAGATFTVTRFDDPVPGACAAQDCSLREAVMAANATSEADVIRLPSGRYELSIPLAGPDLGWQSDEMGDLDLSQDVTIRTIGPGRLAVIDANGTSTGDRVFEVAPALLTTARTQGASYVSVTLAGVVVTGGVASGDGSGGGIHVHPDTSLTVDGGSIRGNRASDRGGGIFVDRARVTLSGVTLAGNEAQKGGAIAQVGGRLELSDSAARGNQAHHSGGALSSTGLAILDRTSLFGNHASAAGGAVSVFACGSVRMTDTTVSDNGPNGALDAHNGTLSLAYSTVTANDGVALHVDDTDGDGCPAEVVLRGTIVAANHAPSAADPPDCRNDDVDPLVTSMGHNLIGDGTDCRLAPAAGDRIGSAADPIDPRLRPLAFNGGPFRGLLTHALRATSPAVGAGDAGNDCAIGVVTDQRGVPRILGGACDIGAYELVACRGVVVNRVGTQGPDRGTDARMRPTTGDDGVLGLGGDDRLAGDTGDDGLCGGSGADELAGGDGDDRLAGGPDRDRCEGGPGRDSGIDCEVTRSIP